MKEQNIKVSVIMGIYNPHCETRFREAVQSIIDQTMKEWELILYDDGSDVSYIERIERAAEMDERIHLICNRDNHGLAYALNQCILLAKGEYIARMDDDDFSSPERLAAQCKWLDEHKEYGWVGSASELFDDNGVWGIDRVPERPKGKDYLFRSPYIHPAVMFRKSILMAVGGYRVSSVIGRCEDYELFMRLQHAGYQGYNIQKPLLRYREDAAAYKKRRYKFRMNEMVIRFQGFRKLGILKTATLPYVIKPLIVGMIPGALHRRIKKRIKKDKR